MLLESNRVAYFPLRMEGGERPAFMNFGPPGEIVGGPIRCLPENWRAMHASETFPRVNRCALVYCTSLDSSGKPYLGASPN